VVRGAVEMQRGLEIERESERARERGRDATNTTGPEEGGDLNTRYEIEPMGRARRMQISPITHAGYFAIIIAVHARGCCKLRRRVSRISEPPGKIHHEVLSP